MDYDGFRLDCGCRCGRCGQYVVLEGVDDAHGNHFCVNCNDYVPTLQERVGRPQVCQERTPDKVEERQRLINEQEDQ